MQNTIQQNIEEIEKKEFEDRTKTLIEEIKAACEKHQVAIEPIITTKGPAFQFIDLKKINAKSNNREAIPGTSNPANR